MNARDGGFLHGGRRQFDGFFLPFFERPLGNFGCPRPRRDAVFGGVEGDIGVDLRRRRHAAWQDGLPAQTIDYRRFPVIKLADKGNSDIVGIDDRGIIARPSIGHVDESQVAYRIDDLFDAVVISCKIHRTRLRFECEIIARCRQ